LAIFDVSLDTANGLYAWGWRLSLGGAVVTAVGIGVLMWGTRVRDHDFEKQVADLHGAAARAEERAGNLESEAAATRERAAGLEKAAAETRLAVEQEHTARLQLEAKHAALQSYQAQRRLTHEEKRTIIAAISPFPGQKVEIQSILGDSDGKEYAEDFVAVFDAAKWDHNGDAGVSYHVWTPEPVGIEVTVNDGYARNVVPGIEALVGALQKLGLIGTTGFIRPEVPVGQVQLRIGRKPPFKDE